MKQVRAFVTLGLLALCYTVAAQEVQVGSHFPLGLSLGINEDANCSLDAPETHGTFRLTSEGKVQVCVSGAWKTLLFQEDQAEGSYINPGTSCASILASNPSAADGLFWIRPTTAVNAFQVYCQMTDIFGGAGTGWTRLSLYDRMYGNTCENLWDTDPILTDWGNRRIGAGSQNPLDSPTSCTGDSLIDDVQWMDANEVLLSEAQISALNTVFSQGTGAYAAGYDNPHTAGVDIKGCFSGTLVMSADVDNKGPSAWGLPTEVTVSKLFTRVIYPGNCNDGGENYSLSRYWYFK